ncbi:MAG: hypothetical protein B6D56_04040 [Candidatus Omnitrophica bacterium 4484_70.1]|nr:MAG: hypothetical protein B6D56_04040 [Candidatus Omnitrophica bacterium 4484_70.1]
MIKIFLCGGLLIFLQNFSLASDKRSFEEKVSVEQVSPEEEIFGGIEKEIKELRKEIEKLRERIREIENELREKLEIIIKQNEKIKQEIHKIKMRV